VVPVDHLNVHGLYVPTGVAVAVPAVGLAQVGAVEVMVGGQQEPTAYRSVIGSLAQPASSHEPDSPSPVVLKETSRLLPGLQVALVVMVRQNFHEQVLIELLSP